MKTKYCCINNFKKGSLTPINLKKKQRGLVTTKLEV